MAAAVCWMAGMFREWREAWLLASWKKRLRPFAWIGAGALVAWAGAWVLRNWLGSVESAEPSEMLAATARAGSRAPLTPRPGGPTAVLPKEVIDCHFEALGGVRRLESIHSVRMTGELTIGDGETRSITVLKKRDSRIRVSLGTVTGQFSMGLHPGDAWRAYWSHGKLVMVEDLDPEQKAFLRFALPVVSELFVALRREWPVAYLGRQTFNGKAAHAFEIELNEREKVRLFLDPETCLALGREELIVGEAGRLSVKRQIFSEYRDADGCLLPGRVESSTDEASHQTIEVARIELNPGILDSTFLRPEARAR